MKTALKASFPLWQLLRDVDEKGPFPFSEESRTVAAFMVMEPTQARSMG
jgi:hypothetical protein